MRERRLQGEEAGPGPGFTPEQLASALDRARDLVHKLEEELVATNQGTIALMMELEQRLDQRTEALRKTQDELERTNSELLQLTLELDDRVAQRTQALQQSEERYRTLSEAAQEAIFLMDRQKRLQYINSFGADLLHSTPQELVGRSLRDLLAGQDRDDVRAIDEALAAVRPHSVDLRLVLPGGGERWLDLQLIALSGGDDGAETVMGVARDVTERRRAEREIRELNAMLEQRIAERTAELAARNRELETFTYSVSHDLKAPLRGIDSYSRLLLQDHGEQLDEEGRLFLRTIRNATDQMGQLIDDLLEYSRFERRHIETRRQSVRELVRAAVDECRVELERVTPRLTVEVPDIEISVDGNALMLVLRNLLDNAIKFTRGVRSPRIEISGRETGDTLTLWVRDNGIGFDMQYHDRIFEIFQRLSHGEDYEGTGIGLAIARRAIERIGGRVWAESAPGQGATFFVELPKG